MAKDLFVWSADFAVGVAAIDAQHKKLVELVNGLHRAMAEGKSPEMLKPLLEDVIEYTQSHFADEEKLMAEHGYPDLALQRGEHRALSLRAAAFMETYRNKSKGKATQAVELMNFLADWLRHHIKGSDRALGIYLNKKGVT